MILKNQEYFTRKIVQKLNTKKELRLRYTYGFTLIEMLVVVSIISIVMVIAIPSFMGMQKKARVSGAAKIISQNFKQARERALASNNTHRFAFNSTSKTYTVSYILQGTTYSTTYKLGGTTGGRIRYGFFGSVSTGPPEATKAPPSGTGVDFSGDTLTLTSHGGASQGVVYITDDNQNYAIGVNGLGKIRVYLNSGKNSNWY